MRRLRAVWIGLVIGLTGCGLTTNTAVKPSTPQVKGQRIAVAAVGDTAVLSAVKEQRGEWEASRESFCVISDKPVTPNHLGDAHVLVFNGEQLGELVDVGALAILPESLFQPLKKEAEPGDENAERAEESATENSDALQFDDIVPSFRDRASKYGKDRVALPIGGSALVLVYNRAAFLRDENKAAANSEGLTLEPPTTWKELDQLAKFFHGRDWDGDHATESGISLALGPDPEGVGDATFLARAASLGQHRDHFSLLFDSDTMEPRLTMPPFVEALEGLVALKAYGPPGVETFDAEAARKAFRDGKVALLIDRAEKFGRWGGGKAKAIGVAALPGSEKVYDPANKRWDPASKPNRPSYLPNGGGWFVGVAATAKNAEREAAIDFITYLINPDTSNRVRSDVGFPMLPVRGSQIGLGLLDPRAAPGVESRVWADAISKTLLAPRVIPGLRIPDASGYLSDLSLGRSSASTGTPAADALKSVSASWSTRTHKLGTARQLWHYNRSLNDVVTTLQPPPRDGN